MAKPHTVIVILEAKKEKEKELEEALKAVIQPSRSEKTCLEYRLHKSIENPRQFVLYENWESKEKHQEQFSKSYIINLSEQLKELLAKPYQAIFAAEI